MKDTILYCNDLQALKDQLKADGYYNEETQSYEVPQLLTPIKYSSDGAKSLSLVRDNILDLSVYTMLEDLGTYDDILADDTKLDKYKSVYPYDVPLTYTDENSNTVEYMRSFKIGEFA